MTQDDLPPIEDREAWKARFGEYRHTPLVRYGAFRIDEEWDRRPPHAEHIWSRHELVFEVNDRYEFDVANLDFVLYRKPRASTAEWAIPTRAQVLHIAIQWWAGMRPATDGGMVSLACYRRRVGSSNDAHEMTFGDWYIGPLFRRPEDPLISMAEAAPFVETALHQLEQLEQFEAGR
jgi:hypothetical protein